MLFLPPKGAGAHVLEIWAVLPVWSSGEPAQGGWWVIPPHCLASVSHSQSGISLLPLLCGPHLLYKKKKIATFQQIHVDECWSCGVISEDSTFIDGFFGLFLAEISGLYPLLELFDERFLTAFLLFIGSVEYTISFWAMGDPQAGRKAASHKPLSSSSCPSELPAVPFLVTISLCI